MIKIKKQEQKQVNKNLLFFGLGFVCIVAIVGLVLNLNGAATPTGAAIQVKYYGVSDELMSDYAETMQTYIELKQPTLRTLSTLKGRTTISKNISQAIDFTTALVKIYKNKLNWLYIS